MDIISGLSWNIRGCNNITSRRNIKAHIRANHINLLCLQETKCISWGSVYKNSLWDSHTHGWLEAPAQGLSGGLLTSWDAQQFRLLSHIINKNWILFKGCTVNTNITFIIINIYAPQSSTNKELLWEQISSLLTTHSDTPICLMGDFNSVLGDDDRVNYQHSTLDTNIFKSFVNNNELIQIKT